MATAYGDRLGKWRAPVEPSESSQRQDTVASPECEPVVEEPQPGLYYRLSPDARGGMVVTEVLYRRAADGRRVVLTRYVSGSRRNRRSCTCGLWRRAGACIHVTTVEWALAEIARARPLPSSCKTKDQHLFVCGACGGDALNGWRHGAALLCAPCLEERWLRERPTNEWQREADFCARCGLLATGLVRVGGARFCSRCAEDMRVQLPRLVFSLYRQIEACERFSRRCLRALGRRSREADLYAADLRHMLAWLRPQAVEVFRQQLARRVEARRSVPPVAAPGQPMGEATPVAFEGVPAAL